MKTQVKCPVCGHHHDYLIHNFYPDLDTPLVEILEEEVPTWRKELGACTQRQKCLPENRKDTICFTFFDKTAGEAW